MPTQTSKSRKGRSNYLRCGTVKYAVNNKPHRKPAAGILDVQNQNS
jgi:hypothetical protein